MVFRRDVESVSRLDYAVRFEGTDLQVFNPTRPSTQRSATGYACWTRPRIVTTWPPSKLI